MELTAELSQDWGNRLGEHIQNLACARIQEKGAVFPQETESDLPVSVHESPVEAWVNSSASGQTRGREQTHPSTRNWIKDLLSMAPPSE